MGRVYIDDVVAGLVAMGAGGGPLAKPVDLGSGTLVTVRAVVEEIEDLMGMEGKASFGVLEDRPFEQDRKADPSATFRALGWEPQVALRAGLTKIIDWYRSNLGLAESWTQEACFGPAPR